MRWACLAQVRLENVSKYYIDPEKIHLSRNEQFVKALDSVSMTVNDGETMAILGPSGCGKSTLLKVVAGLEECDEGKVFFDSDDVTRLSPKDRGVGMVFQDYALYPSHKGKGNLSYFFWVRRRSQAEIDARVREVAEILGVGFNELMGRLPGTLSGGEQQRVAIGRCIVRDPTLFLMDEPICNLDAKLRVQTRSEIKRLLRRFNITTMYVTHDQAEAVAMGDRICVMKSGKVQQIGTYEEVYLDPVNQFVAGFIGSPPMGFYEAQMVGEGVLSVEGIEIQLSPIRAAGVPGDLPLVVGIRPEDMLLADDQARSYLVGKVSVVEPLPALHSNLAFVTVNGKEFAIRVPDQRRIRIGDELRLVPDPEKIYIFDRLTGRALLTQASGRLS